MDLENYAKWSKPVRERQIPYDFTHVESNEQTELTTKIETRLTEKEQVESYEDE